MYKQQIINEFLDKYDCWENQNKKWLSNHIKNTDLLLKEFLKMYPLSKIKKMKIDEYVVGKEIDLTYCWWIETKLCELGEIRGIKITAYQKFGIYYDKIKKDYSFGSRVTKKTKFGNNSLEIYRNIKNAIILLLDDITKKNYDGIAKNILNPLFKNKITYLYDSENWIPIYSDSDLNTLLSILDIPFNRDIDRVHKRIKLYDFYKALNRQDITPLSFMNFIYSDLGYKNELRKVDFSNLNVNEVKKFKLVVVKNISELIPQSIYSNNGLVDEKIESVIERKIIGKKGEEIVKKYLLYHKKELGIIGEIDCACEYDDSKHYDFSYKTLDGSTIYIESKATKFNRNQSIIFDMSVDEYNFMKLHEMEYYVLFINDINNGTVIKQIPASLIVGRPVKYRISLTDATNK